MKRSIQDSAKRAVIAVGRGRGFVMEIAERMGGYTGVRRVVVTASHCLPYLPPTMSSAAADEKTYSALLGPLSSSEPSIATECLFVDPVADIAVLGEPDDQIYVKDSSAFQNLLNGAATLRLGDIPSRKTQQAWALSLDGWWMPCTVRNNYSGRGITITSSTEGIVGRMSGSPIVSDAGRAVGVISMFIVGSGLYAHVPQPRLTYCLPGWLIQKRRKGKG